MKKYPGFITPQLFCRDLHRYHIKNARFDKLLSFHRFHGGVPLMHDSEHLYIDNSDCHTLIYGSTGSMKTRCIIMPSIIMLGKASESMIINDSKGELYYRLAGRLKNEGYNIITLNLRNPRLDNSWNPLIIPYNFYLNGDIDRAAEFASDIANNLMKTDKVSNADPFWENSASNTMMGLIMLLFKWCKDHELSKDAVNIGNIFLLRHALFKDNKNAKSSPLWEYASQDEMIYVSLSGAINAPSDTMSSMLSVFDEHLRALTIQPSLLDMLSNNDFDIADIINKKTAVFLITPDEKTTYHTLCSLFIKQSYEYFIYMAAQSESQELSNRLNYVLDEFSSLPTIDSFPSMITAARSRNIRFIIVTQSKSALTYKYSQEAATIISNCNNLVFFTSRELDLLNEISSLCGMQKNHVPNISIYDLQHLDKDTHEALVMRGRSKPTLVNMLDIDKFDHKRFTQLKHECYERCPRIKIDFNLSSEEPRNSQSLFDSLINQLGLSMKQSESDSIEDDINSSSQDFDNE